jgi:hypothetical protein
MVASGDLVMINRAVEINVAGSRFLVMRNNAAAEQVM